MKGGVTTINNPKIQFMSGVNVQLQKYALNDELVHNILNLLYEYETNNIDDLVNEFETIEGYYEQVENQINYDTNKGLLENLIALKNVMGFFEDSSDVGLYNEIQDGLETAINKYSKNLSDFNSYNRKTKSKSKTKRMKNKTRSILKTNTRTSKSKSKSKSKTRRNRSI